MEWREVAFSSIPNCFHAVSLPQSSERSEKNDLIARRALVISTTGICRIITYKSASTRARWLRSEIRAVNLVEIMRVQIDTSKFLEVADVKLCQWNGNSFLCTSWVQQDANCCTLAQFVAMFRVNEDVIEFVEQLNVDKPWAWTTIIGSVDGPVFVLFPLRSEPIFFKVSQNNLTRVDGLKTESSTKLGDLASTMNKNIVLRNSRYVDGDYVWNVLGTEAGVVTISLFDSRTGNSIGCRSFKFSGIVSIVEFLEASREEKMAQIGSEVLLLVSSSVGPAAIWQCWVSETGQLSMSTGGCELHESTGKDVITSAFVTRNWLFIGTYAGIFLVYQRPKFFDLLPEVLDTTYQVDIASPIINLCSLDEEGHTTGVLTTEGFHVIHFQERPASSGTYHASIENEIDQMEGDIGSRLAEEPVLPSEPKFTLGPETTVPVSPGNNPPIKSPPNENRGNRRRAELPSGGRIRPDSLAIDRATFRL